MTSSARPWLGRSHDQLAELARELLLCGHLIDRSGMPHLISAFGREGMTEIAIAEWMGASPVYTKRTQRLLGFEGDTVEVAFKCIQIDIGAPPEFLDFRFEVTDDHHGRFHLAHCGALMDVEPMGDEFVHAMCHTIEDPTFDATATAVNPRAQVRPVHRPPRTPADRHPHCEWTVTVVPEADPLPVPEQAVAMWRSNAAQLPLASADPDLPDDDGWNDYAAPLDPDLVMERFSSATLGRICDEVALQGHLLTRSYLVEVAERLPADEVAAMAAKQAAGVAGVSTKRLARALGVGADLDGLATVLAVHPLLLPPAYTGARVERDDDAVVVSIEASPGTSEVDGLSWPAVLVGPTGDEALEAAVITLVRTAAIERVEPIGAEVARWRITDDADREPAPIPGTVTLTEFSTGAAFEFQRRG